MTTIFSTSTTKDLELRRLGLFQVPTEIVGSAELRKCKHEKNKTKQKNGGNWEEAGPSFSLFSALPLLCLPQSFVSSQPSENLEQAKDDYDKNPASGQNGARPGTVLLKV